MYTSNEAAKQYGISEGTLRSAMKTGKLKLGTDYRKAGRITLITKKAMEREYGK
ncbi:helix-turn-helix domain-containing protein [Clostridium botulinum]|uniref:helix-turn-helix domain-containing protein n=1 Tax=Clostridium botulinum TaxID=1491 RepID=UPI003DA32186